jgi:hypothetical protein
MGKELGKRQILFQAMRFGQISLTFWKMVDLDGESQNQLFRTLADWTECLTEVQGDFPSRPPPPPSGPTP